MTATALRGLYEGLWRRMAALPTHFAYTVPKNQLETSHARGRGSRLDGYFDASHSASTEFCLIHSGRRYYRSAVRTGKEWHELISTDDHPARSDSQTAFTNPISDRNCVPPLGLPFRSRQYVKQRRSFARVIATYSNLLASSISLS